MLAQLHSSGAFVFGGIWLFMLLIVLLLCVFWVWMLIDALTNTALQGTEKVLWVLVILFGHFLGALIYFFVARGGRSRPVV